MEFMAEEIISAPSLSTEAKSTPEVAVSAAPVSEAQIAPIPAESLVTEPSVVTEKTVETPVEAVKNAEAENTVLGEDKPKEEKKPEVENAKKPDETTEAKSNPEDDKPVEDVSKEIPLPTYEDFKLPEGVTLDKNQISDFNKMLGDFEVKNKADHVAVQEFGQKAIDKYISEMQEATKRLHEGYQNSWQKQKNDWYEQFKADSEIGGNRLDTTSSLVRNAIESYGGSTEQKAEFRKLMKDTGIGNAPALIRTFANLSNEISRLKGKYESETGENQPKQLAGTRPNAPKLSKIEKRYGTQSI